MVSLLSTVRDIERLRQILLVLVRHGFGEVVQRTGLGKLSVGKNKEGQEAADPLLKTQDLQEHAEESQSQEGVGFGRRLRLVLQDLGPSFIKLGQILSTRSDLLPKDVITELKELQDQVQEVPFDQIKSSLEAGLGTKTETFFSSFEEVPIGRASIAQVHRARLKHPIEGLDNVVVKVQRPNIKGIIERDIELLYILAKAIERTIPEARIYSPVGLVTEFDRAMSAELDFTREAENARRFVRSFGQDDTVQFPSIVSEASSKTVLTMEFLEGQKISKALENGFDGEALARQTLKILFKQIFEDGFFHGDPHPGNLMVLGTPNTAVLGMIDLGLVGRLSPQLRDKTVDLMLAAVRKDAQGVADALYVIGTPTKKIDRPKYDAEVSFLAEKYLGRPLKEIEISLLIRDIVQGAVKYGLEIPSEFLMLGRTLMTLEGVGKQLHPNLDVFNELKPYVVQMVKMRYSPERLSSELVRTLTRFGGAAGSYPEKIDESLDDLRRGTLVISTRDPEMPQATDLLGRRIFSGLTVAALIGGGSILVSNGGPTLPGYIMLCAAGVWLLGHAFKAARKAKAIDRESS